MTMSSSGLVSAITETPTSIPTRTPSVMPSLKPSTTPSSIPSLSPSSSPSNVPSLTLTSVPSEVPSLDPTDAPDCFFDEIKGQSYYAMTFNLCLEVDMFGGAISLVNVAAENCLLEYVFSAHKITLSDLVTPVDGLNCIFEFDGSAYGNNGYSGNVTFVEDETVTGTEVVVLSADPTDRLFEFMIRLPSCHAPSVMPSNLHSLVPSLVHSSIPTRVPECEIAEVSGTSYYFALFNLCLEIQMWQGGHIHQVQTDFLNSNCTPENAMSKIEISTFVSATDSVATLKREYLMVPSNSDKRLSLSLNITSYLTILWKERLH